MIKEPREYIWAFPFIGAILIIISIFTPAYYIELMGIEEYSWMWGIFYSSVPGYSSQTTFIASEQPLQYTLPIFFMGFIPFLIILVGSIALLISANAVRTGRIDIKNRETQWITIGIAMILAPIIYIIGIDVTMMNYVEYQLEQIYGYVPPGIADFWDIYNPGFALIAPFLGAGLAITGSIASKTIKPREMPIYIREKQDIITKKPNGGISRKIKFCSECGHQLLYNGAKFCSNCGKEIIF